MDRKMDESKLVDYLYGEMSEQEKILFEQELARDPELAAEVKGLKATRGMIENMPDREVAEPRIILKEKRSGLWKWMSAAAVVLILLWAGFASGLKVTIGKGMIAIGYGTIQQDNGYSREEVEQLVGQAMAGYSEKNKSEMNALKSEFYGQVSKLNSDYDTRIESAAQQIAGKSKKLVAEYVAQMDLQQREQIQTLFAVNAEEQKQRMQGLLADYNAYLEEQREGDMEYLTAYIQSVEETNTDNQWQTNQLLRTIIEQVNNQVAAD